jgi:hypothetical protein
MILEYLLSDISILQLPKCPLIHNFWISGVIEYRGRDPGLSSREINQGNVRKKEKMAMYFENEPPAKAYVAYFL